MNKIYNDAKDEHVKTYVLYCNGEILANNLSSLYIDSNCTIEATPENTNITKFDNIKIVNADNGVVFIPLSVYSDPDDSGSYLAVINEKEDDSLHLLELSIGWSR